MGFGDDKFKSQSNYNIISDEHWNNTETTKKRH